LADGANGVEHQDGDADWTSTLTTYHPRGGGQSSSKHLHGEPWLDFNMIQTTTRFEFAKYETVAADYALHPPKPTLDAEVAYEDSLSLNRKLPQDRRISPWDVRRAAYWSVFAGSAWVRTARSHHLGPTRAGVRSSLAASQPAGPRARSRGRSSAQFPAYVVVGGGRRWTRSHGSNPESADQHLRGQGRGAHQRSLDEAADVIYLAEAGEVSIDMSKLTAVPAQVTWYDPQTGARTAAGTYSNTGKHSFSPPAGWEDAVLLLEASDKPPPTRP
jgi:hypothetical protein